MRSLKDRLRGGSSEEISIVMKTWKIVQIVIVGVICFLVLLTSIYTVEETQQAIITTFGKVTKVEEAGLNFKLPFPIQGITKVDVNKTQKMQIGYTTVEDEAIAESNVSESKMITGDFNIVNIDFFIEWKISDPVKYVYSTNDPEAVLNYIAQASARSVVGSKGVDGVLTTEKSLIEEEIKEKMMTKLEVYGIGIQINDVKIQDSEPPTVEVQNAFKAVETAKQQKETFINDALAYKNSKIPEAQSAADKLIRQAEAYKQNKINEARGEVAKFNSMYVEYAKNKAMTRTRMYLQTIESVLPNVEVYIDSSNNGVQKVLPLKDFATTTITNNGGDTNAETK